MKGVIVFACFFSFSLLNAQNIQDLASINKKIDSIMSFFNNSSFPATTVEVIKNGKSIYSKGFGKEDIETTIPATSKSNFNIASNSKQFTAMCIMLLQEDGKLKRTDDIRKYLPEIPVYDKPITINDLLHHTSGLRDYLELYHLTCKPIFELSKKEILKLIANQKQLNFSPRENHLYSNTNYFLLGIIIERVSGISLHKYIRKNIFIPLGMKHTYFSDERFVTNEVKSYRQNKNTLVLTKNTYPIIYGDGGILSNTDDLFLWDQNFYHNILGKKTNELITEIQDPGILNNKENTFYAGGLFNIQYKGTQAILHGGEYNSFSTQILRFPSDSLSVILLSAINNDPDYYCFKIADLFFQNAQQNDLVLPSNHLTSENHSGYYFNETLSAYRYLAQNDSFITTNGQRFTQIGNNQYLTHDIWGREKCLTFSILPNSELMMSYQVAYVNDLYRKIKEDSLNKNYNGIYYCPELPKLEFELNFIENNPVFLVNGKYSADVTKTFGTMGIIPTFGAFVEFEVNSENKVAGFKLSTDRVKNLFFKKKQ